MYQNGKQLNRYAAKMIHKKHMKDRYMNWPFGGLHTSWVDYVAHKRPWDDLEYWRYYDASGPRSFAAKCTNRRLRNSFRHDMASQNFIDMYAPQHAYYKKYFDYCWAIW